MTTQAAVSQAAEQSRFRPLELRGYLFWGPTAVLILALELLGIGKVEQFDAWPTISTTLGDLQDRESIWGLPIVFLITLAAFYAVAFRNRQLREGRERYLRYNALVVYAAIAVAIFVALQVSDDKITRGYIIYGTAAVFALLIPFTIGLVKDKGVGFPSLFFTFACLRDRWRPLAALVVGLLAILVLHLALYPWPDLAREPGTYAGLTARDARADALETLGATPGVKPALAFSTTLRSVSNGSNAWHVYFNDLVDGKPVFDGCFVVVAKGRAGEPSEDCLA